MRAIQLLPYYSNFENHASKSKQKYAPPTLDRAAWKQVSSEVFGIFILTHIEHYKFD